jgi:type I restriction enzyme S subunit
MGEWKRVRLVDLCEVHVDCVNRTAPVVDGPTPYRMIRTTNVRGGFVDTSEVRYVTEEIFARWTRRLVPRRGDVILTREAPLGEVGKLRSDENIFLGQRLYHFRADPRRGDADFILYALLAQDLQAQIRSLGSGSTVEHMRLPDIEKLELNAPEIGVQRRIGSVLAAYDDLIENNTKRIGVLEEIARVLYREWFVRRYDMQWVCTNLGRVVDVNEVSVSPENPPESIRYVDISAVSPGQVDDVPVIPFASAPGRARRVVRHGDTIWSCVRPNRRSHALMIEPSDDTVVSTGFAVLTPRQLSPAYLYLATTTDEFVAHLESRATGAAYPAVTAAVFEAAPIVVPPVDLRRRFEGTAMPLLDQADLLRRRNHRLRAARDLLLPKLLSGELSVDRIPDPAEVAP